MTTHSPKRLCVEPPSPSIASTLSAVLLSEPALLAAIVDFVDAEETTDGAPCKPTPTPALQVIATLCRAIPGLSKLIGPTNEAFWRDMVLAHFNFTVGNMTFNVDDWGDGTRVCAESDLDHPSSARFDNLYFSTDRRVYAKSESDEDDDDDDDDEDDDEDDDDENSNDDDKEIKVENDPCDDAQFADWHRHPWNGPLREWQQSRRPRDCKWERRRRRRTEYSFLVEDLQYWPSLKTYFPPQTYGFLGRIQRDRTLLATEWPRHEDAFSLYCDLLLLPRFQGGAQDHWTTNSDGEQFAYPCLMGRFPTKIVGRGFAMLRFCGIAPRFWYLNNKPVSERWSGLDGPLPPIECKWADVSESDRFRLGYALVRHSACDARTDEEESLFPNWRSLDPDAHPFQELRRFVYETFTDWRRVQVNCGELPSPIFYIGRSKRSGRWLGFVGQSDYFTP